MTWTYNTAIVVAGTSLLGACAGLVGSFAVLRRRALVGDALAHAALPGICLAFLVVRERVLPALLVGALATGVLGVLLISGLQSGTRIKEDAAIGIVLSVFYGAGIVLLTIIARGVAGGSKAGLSSYILGQASTISRTDVLLIAAVAAGCLVLILLMYKEFKLVAFDPDFAGAQGWPAFRLDLLLMSLIAVTVVTGLPMVGVVLTAALLIIPAATARFWTDRLANLLLLSAMLGLAIGGLGVLPSAVFDGMPGGPPIVLTGAALFLASVLVAPRRGAIARWITAVCYRRRIADQSALRVLHQCLADRPGGATMSIADFQQRKAWSESAIRRALSRLAAEGLVDEASQGGWRFTEAGLSRAAAVVRASRLWEVFLTEHPETAAGFVDLDVMTLESRLPHEMIIELEKVLSRTDARAADD